MADINYWAVLIAGAVHFAIGAFWYSPALFGKIWMKGAGKTEADMKGHGAGKYYFIGFLSTLVLVWVLAVTLKISGTNTLSTALQGGFWLWLGFVAMTQLGSVLWEKKPFSFYLVNTLYYLVGILVASWILFIW